MSSTPISRSADLARLRDEGYHVEVRAEPAYLLIHDVPYVDQQSEVRRGVLVSTLALNGNATARPDTHVVMFAGDLPCDQLGKPLTKILHSSSHQVLAPDLEIDHTFSSKPPEGYADYHAKMTAYIRILEGHAQALDPTVTSRTFPVVVNEDAASPFRYLDTATSRVGIGAATAKLSGQRVGIIGLGGTGGYVLDPVAKTPVAEVHLYDGDFMHQHSAFRAPGAVPIERLNMLKVDYLGDIYDQMHTGIVRHPIFIDETNVDELLDLDFVFICVDDADTRRLMVDALDSSSVPFIDVGMGIEVRDGSLNGILRTTLSTPDDRATAHLFMPLRNADVDNDYVHNIQVADLNMLNAALAVVRWKRSLGFYVDYVREQHSSYTIDGARLINEYRHDGA
jgi:uncharacterized protein DUF6791/ThiF family protein